MAEDGLELFRKNFPDMKLKKSPLPTMKVDVPGKEPKEVTLHPADPKDARSVIARDADGNEFPLEKSKQDLAESISKNPPPRNPK